MIECFAKKNFKPVFSNDSTPHLHSISKRTLDSDFFIARVMHSHNDLLEIYFVKSGTGIYVVDNVRYSVKKGDIVICNSNVLHDEVQDPDSNISCYCCAISDLQLPGLHKNCLIQDEICPVFSSGEYYDDINELMRMIYLFLSSDRNHSNEICNHLMVALITITMGIISNNQKKVDFESKKHKLIYTQIKKYIDSHYSEDINLKTLAKAMNMSPYYLSHLFKDVAGYSPMQYVLRRRIGESQSLLINSKDSITEVASKVGFDNPNYFDIIFTKKIGMPPTQFRKAYVNISK